MRQTSAQPAAGPWRLRHAEASGHGVDQSELSRPASEPRACRYGQARRALVFDPEAWRRRQDFGVQAALYGGLAVVSAALTAGLEFAWYGLATRVDLTELTHCANPGTLANAYT